MEIVFFHDFITPQEQTELLEWAHKMLPHLDPNGEQRAFKKVCLLPWRPPAYDVVRLRLQERVALKEIVREPMFGWYLSSIGEGGAVHRHKDPTPPGHRHLRCNIFLQLPEGGGLPIVEDQTQPVRERSFLCFFPSDLWHGSQAVEGRGKRRVICSFGYLVRDTYRLPGWVDARVGQEAEAVAP